MTKKRFSMKQILCPSFQYCVYSVVLEKKIKNKDSQLFMIWYYFKQGAMESVMLKGVLKGV